MRGACKRQRLSLSTEKACAHWVNHQGLFLKGRSQFKDAPPHDKMEAFLPHLAEKLVKACPAPPANPLSPALGMAFNPNLVVFVFRDPVSVPALR